MKQILNTKFQKYIRNLIFGDSTGSINTYYRAVTNQNSKEDITNLGTTTFKQIDAMNISSSENYIYLAGVTGPKENYIHLRTLNTLNIDLPVYNINGDIAAGAIAKSLKSRRLLLMTNVEGVLDKDKKLINEITSTEVLKMVENNIITEGMIPKINTCLDAVKNGVTAVGIIDGRKQHSILFEIFSDKGSGTLIRK